MNSYHCVGELPADVQSNTNEIEAVPTTIPDTAAVEDLLTHPAAGQIAHIATHAIVETANNQ